MKRKRRSLSDPPVEWIDLLESHAAGVRRLRLLWRRGSSTYRPMVPIDVDLDALEGRPESEWERLELPETHFRWTLAEDALDDPHPQVCELVSELWRIAADYTRDFGSWCDYKLMAFGDDGEQLFAHGCRCRLPHRRTGRNRDLEPEQSEPAPRPAQPSPAREPERGEEFAVFKDASMWVDGRKNQLIDSLAAERQWAANSAREALDSAPAMFSQAGTILKSAISYQNKVVEQLRDHASGEADLRQRMVMEAERTKRFGQGIQLAKYLADTFVSSVIPLVNHGMEVFADRRITVYPEFSTAQQAMSYLVSSLSATRLSKMWDGNRDAAGAFMVMLDDASRIRNEKESLESAGELMLILRSERFEKNTINEEQMAARYIIGRYALYRMDMFGNEAAE